MLVRKGKISQSSSSVKPTGIFVLIAPTGTEEVQGKREGYGGVDVSTFSHAG